MATTPLFTAIVHTFNRPALLKLAVEALLRQTYTNLEIILINNGATPETVEYLKEVSSQDTRIKLINYAENQFSWDDPLKYISVCWNAALESATGDYVWIQEDDDLISDDYAGKMVSLFQENPECTTAAGLMVGIDEAGNKVNTAPRVSNFRSRFMPGHLLALDYLRGGRIVFSAPGTIFTFKRDVLINAGGFNRSIVLSQMYGIVPFGVTGFDETALCYWRYHPDTLNRKLSTAGWIGIKENLAMIDEWDINGRWQGFGADIAQEIVTRLKAEESNTSASWFLISLNHCRFKASWRILSKIWTHPRFWLKVVGLTPSINPLNRTLRPVVRLALKLLPGIANRSPWLNKIRDRVNR